MVSILTGSRLVVSARVAASMMRCRLRWASLRPPGRRSDSDTGITSQSESVPLLLGSSRASGIGSAYGHRIGRTTTMTTSHADAYAYGKLGDHDVLRIGFGAMQLEHADPADAVRVLHRAVELGVHHLDTAQFYGKVNDLIRTALHPYADSLRIVTKVGAVTHPTERLVAAQKPAQLRASVEENLRALDTDYLAVVNLRRADTPPGITATGDQVVDLDSQLAELIALRDEGKIGGIGLSHVSLAQLRQALPVGLACVQNLYNVLTRGQEDVL